LGGRKGGREGGREDVLAEESLDVVEKFREIRFKGRGVGHGTISVVLREGGREGGRECERVRGSGHVDDDRQCGRGRREGGWEGGREGG